MLTHADLGVKLRAARETSGLTQQEASEKLGIGRQKLINIEKGAAPVDTVLLKQIADLYGYSIDYFFADDDSEEDFQVRFAFRATELVTQDQKIINWARKVMINIKSLQDIDKGLV
ncbi:hypothetical protein J2TS6_44150 [Paenibacillus albilobatus]|uniref:HTH cro/C1-type domain-containing protein n=1 Tax=Paenibacillus albilobatus TaxID=2716884 RepID=A0A919XIG0_9BACL|nr:helix-turn-helix transcriptional regulator [Paenibacillus albilobatus]GIO33274.1 hypothetical protein J2TS6_44150 [Paenibacillus albilobatus]